MHLTEILMHFDLERRFKRVVYRKGGVAHGHFEVTLKVAKYAKSKSLPKVKNKTDLSVRFSTLRGGKGSNDTARDLRGFVIKFSPFHSLDCIYKPMAIYDSIW
jgi:catalase